MIIYAFCRVPCDQDEDLVFSGFALKSHDFDRRILRGPALGKILWQRDAVRRSIRESTGKLSINRPDKCTLLRA